MDFTKISPQLFGAFKTEGGAHKRPQDVEFWMGWNPEQQKQTWSGVQPSTYKILDPDKESYQLALQKMPNTIIVLRSWHLDDNNGDRWNELMANPIAAGEAIVDRWLEMTANWDIDYSRTTFMLWNEPHEWEGDAAKRNLTTATLAAMRRRKKLRPQMSLLLIDLGVGWPGNHDTATVKDTPPDWSPYEPVHQEMLIDKIDFLGLHEYWTINGPTAGFKWLCGRFLQCPWNVPIIIGEAAYSGAVGKPQGSVPTALQGWSVSGMTAEQYMAQMIAYNEICRSDSRLIGWEVYLVDYANREWQAKDIEPMYGLLRTNLSKFAPRKQSFTWGSTPVTPPVVVVPPVVVTPPVASAGSAWRWPLDEVVFTWFWGVPEASLLRRTSQVGTETYKAHEGVDLRAAVGTKVLSAADGVVAFTGFDEGGYGNYIRIRHGKAGAKWDSFYGHLRDMPVLKTGATVIKGAQVGWSGNTGHSTGAHLHFEVRLVKADGSWDTGAPGSIGNGSVDPVAFFSGLDRSRDYGAPLVYEATPDFLRSMAFVLPHEGGWSEDAGGTMKGITMATYAAWCAEQGRPVPTKEDLKNIDDTDLQQIYLTKYWLLAGADKLQWPLQLAHFDAAVNSGPGQAAIFLKSAGGDFQEYMGQRVDWYTRITGWEVNGKGWIRRCADLLKAAG